MERPGQVPARRAAWSRSPVVRWSSTRRIPGGVAVVAMDLQPDSPHHPLAWRGQFDEFRRPLRQVAGQANETVAAERGLQLGVTAVGAQRHLRPRGQVGHKLRFRKQGQVFLQRHNAVAGRAGGEIRRLRWQGLAPGRRIGRLQPPWVDVQSLRSAICPRPMNA
jgi:hypothetical protein